MHSPCLWRHWLIGMVLLLVAAGLVPTHLAEPGVFDQLPGKVEDLFLGFPMAGLPGIAALIPYPAGEIVAWPAARASGRLPAA